MVHGKLMHLIGDEVHMNIAVVLSRVMMGDTIYDALLKSALSGYSYEIQQIASMCGTDRSLNDVGREYIRLQCDRSQMVKLLYSNYLLEII